MTALPIEDAIGILANIENPTEFSQSLVNQYRERGSLSSKQEYWAQKLASEAKRTPATDPVTCERLGRLAPMIAFMTHPDGSKIKVRVRKSRASAKKIHISADGEYCGTLIDDAEGRVNIKHYAPAGLLDFLQELAADPETFAQQYGQETGECGMCGRTLTDPESIARGIGPICMERFG